MTAERGAATLPLVGTVVLAALLAAFIGDVAVLMRARGQAMIAADAAALAAAPVTFAGFGAAGGPEAEARRFAAANRAELVSCDCGVDPTWRPRTVRVVVGVSVDLTLFGVRRVGASSRAEFTPTELPP